MFAFVRQASAAWQWLNPLVPVSVQVCEHFIFKIPDRHGFFPFVPSHVPFKDVLVGWLVGWLGQGGIPFPSSRGSQGGG